MKFTDISFALSRICVDVLAILLAFMLAYFWRMGWLPWEALNFFPAPTTLMPIEVFWGWASKITLVVIFVFILRREYRFHPEEKFSQEIANVSLSLATALAIVLAYFFFSQWYFFSRLIFGLGGILALLFLWFGRVWLRSIRLMIYRRGWGRKNILIIGSGQIASSITESLSRQPQYQLVGVLTENPTQKKELFGRPVLGAALNLEAALKKEMIDEVWLASDQGTEDLTDRLVKIAHIHHKKFRFFPDELGMDLAAVSSSTFLGTPMLTLLHTKLDGWGLVVKTMIDLVLGVIALVLLSPVLLVTALCIWIGNPKAPVIYSSKRVGKNGVCFDCLKFRTMVPDADRQKSQLQSKNQRGQILFKIHDDPRITSLGKFLRKYSIDELPQIFNVLRLEMSFIGPRPHLVEEVAQYPALDRQVLSIRPGLSGFAQVNGRSSLSFREEMKYEMYYLKNWSLWLDVIIFFKSIGVVLTGKDAS